MGEITVLFDELLAVLNHPVSQLFLISAVVSSAVTAIRYMSRERVSLNEDVAKASGKKHHYVAKSSWIGKLDWGKGQWLQATIILSILYIFKWLPSLGGPIVTIGAGTIACIGLHSGAKNAKQSTPIQWLGNLLIGKIKDKLGKSDGE